MPVRSLQLGVVSIVLALAAPALYAANVYRVKPVAIIDHNGFGKPMPIAWVMIPPDWHTQGGYYWGKKGPCSPASQLRWSATDPSGAYAVSMLPGFVWAADSAAPRLPPGMGCPRYNFTSLRQYFQFFVQSFRPGARIIDFRRRPDIERAMPPLKLTNTAFTRSQTKREAGDVLIAYSQGGRDYREILNTSVYITQTTLALAGSVSHSLTGLANAVFALRAPAGKLDFRFFRLVRTSQTVNPIWSQLMAQHNAKIAEINMKGLKQRGEIMRKMYADVSRISMEGYWKRAAMWNRVHAKESRANREVDLYKDPGTGERVELPQNFRNAWRLNDGSYLLSDIAGYNPNEHGINAQRLNQIDQ